MELRHIRYFLAIAEEGSFTRAAERLGIGQPPLSQQIKALEDEVGVRLFRRLAHGAELTEAGQAFHGAVAGMPGQASEAMRLARRAAGGESGLLRVGFTGTAALNPTVPACIRAFRKNYPDVELQVTEANSVALAAALMEDRLDVAILRPARSDPQELTEEILEEELLVAALPVSHPLAAGPEAIRLAALSASPFILTPRDVAVSLHDAVLEACASVGFAPQIGQPAPQIASILSLVSAELGVSLVPRSIARIALPGVVLKPLLDTEQRIGLAVCYRHGSTRPTVRNFVATARRAVVVMP